MDIWQPDTGANLVPSLTASKWVLLQPRISLARDTSALRELLQRQSRQGISGTVVAHCARVCSRDLSCSMMLRTMKCANIWSRLGGKSVFLGMTRDSAGGLDCSRHGE